jgi:parvulin-like peptidyl-prolyl isomerase
MVGVATMLAGCNTDPSAAAVVGGDTISVSTLQDDVHEALATPQISAVLARDPAAFTRQVLSQLISYRVVDAAAADHDVTVTPTEVQGQINSFAQQAGGLDQLYQQAATQGGLTRSAFGPFIRNFVLEQKLADALLAAQPVTDADVAAQYQANISQYEQVHVAHILVAQKSLADRLLAEVRAHPDRFAALAKQDSTDTQSAKNGGDLGFASPSQFVQPFADAVVHAKPGSYIEVHSQFGWHVVHVIDVRTQSLSQVGPQIRSDLEKTQRQKLLGQALTAEAQKLGVHVNPRYGRYDPTQATIVPADPATSVSSPSPTASTAPAGPSTGF